LGFNLQVTIDNRMVFSPPLKITLGTLTRILPKNFQMLHIFKRCYPIDKLTITVYKTGGCPV